VLLSRLSSTAAKSWLVTLLVRISIQVGANDGENIGITINANSDWNKLGALAVGNDTASQAFATATGTVLRPLLKQVQDGTANFCCLYCYNWYSSNDSKSEQRWLDSRSVNVLSGGFDVLSSSVLKDVDAAIKAVDNQRSDLGAIQNRFESTISNLNNTVSNLSAAQSRIQDADYATEVSNMSRAQILQQAGTSVLAQANQVPQTVCPCCVNSDIAKQRSASGLAFLFL
jgi:flagellin